MLNLIPHNAYEIIGQKAQKRIKIQTFANSLDEFIAKFARFVKIKA